MKITNKNRLAAAVLGDLKKLVGSLPAVVIGSKVYYVAPRTMLGETFSKKYKISERQVYRILSLLKNSGHIHTLIKKHEGKTALHIHIVHQPVQLRKGSLNKNVKSRKRRFPKHLPKTVIINILKILKNIERTFQVLITTIMK